MTPARRIHRLLLILVFAGCTGDKAAPGVNDSTYIASMVALYRVALDTTLDSAGRVAARRSVLQQRGLTSDQLERWARGLARDPKHATDVASEISRKVQQFEPSRRPDARVPSRPPPPPSPRPTRK
jgi:hypothetical protein